MELTLGKPIRITVMAHGFTLHASEARAVSFWIQEQLGNIPMEGIEAKIIQLNQDPFMRAGSYVATYQQPGTGYVIERISGVEADAPKGK